MQSDIHPKYFEKAKVTCACGNTFTVGSTEESITVEICSECHPLYTGKEKVIDIAGRVERFKARRTEATKRQGEISAKKKITVTKKVLKLKKEKAKKKS